MEQSDDMYILHVSNSFNLAYIEDTQLDKMLTK